MIFNKNYVKIYYKNKKRGRIIVYKEKIESIIENLMEQLYEAKRFNNLNCNSFERNIFEAEMKEL